MYLEEHRHHHTRTAYPLNLHVALVKVAALSLQSTKRRSNTLQPPRTVLIRPA